MYNMVLVRFGYYGNGKFDADSKESLLNLDLVTSITPKIMCQIDNVVMQVYEVTYADNYRYCAGNALENLFNEQ